MKIFKHIGLFCVLLSVLIVVSCSPKNALPVSNPAKVKPLNDEQQLRKQLYFSEAMRFFELRDWEAADALFRKTIEIDAGCDACFYKLGTMYFHSGLAPEALSLSESAVRLDSSNFWYRVQLAQLYTATRQYPKAIEAYRHLLAMRPTSQELYFDLSTLYLRTNELDSALAVLNLAEQKVGYSEPVAGTRFEILSAQDKTNEAVAELERLVREFPEARYYTLLGEQYLNMQRDSLSLQMFQQALTLESNYMPALFGESEHYRRQSDFDTFFEKIYNLCGNANVEKRYKVEYLSAIIEIPQFSQTFSPKFDTVFSYLRAPADTLSEPLYATFLMQTGKRDSAEIVLKNNVLNNREKKEAWHQFLVLEYYLEKWDSLSLYTEEAHIIFPQEVDFMTLKAIALWQIKKESEAIIWLEKALPLAENTPQKVQIYSFLGDLYHTQNNSEKSYENYEKVLAIDSANIVVLNNYAYYLSEENKQLDKAYAMSKQAIEAEPNNATYLDTFGWILFKMGKAIEAKAIFRQAMIYGGKESAVILDHYGDVLNELGERDTAIVYWEMSVQKEANPAVSAKIKNTK